ncbi:MAG: YkgJ family cysteine cluster protein [Candidatus Hydrothermarchaeales archaeon]
MSKKCPTCGKKLGKKIFDRHMADVHGIVENRFVCFDDCVQCCSNNTLPISLSIDDLKRLADHLRITLVELFSKYCIIGAAQARDDNNVFFANVDFPRPCKFLKDMLCSVYPARPLQCRLFPYSIRYNTTNWDDHPDHRCVEEGLINFSPKEMNQLEETRRKSEKELIETGDFFGYKKYRVEIESYHLNQLIPEFNRITGLNMTEVEVADKKRYRFTMGKADVSYDPQKHGEIFRKLVVKLAESELNKLVQNDFLKKIESIS